MKQAFCRTLRLASLGLAAAIIPGPPATAAGFSVLITPPRFELRAQPGQVLREVLEITNVAGATAKLTVQTAEWSFGGDGSVVFVNALAEGSCRPWTALEARELQLGPNGVRRFRFEVAVPQDAATGECRFAILFEGEPAAVGQLALPVAGRLGIIVYVAVGDARPQIELHAPTVVELQGQRVPALTVTNTGNAHARLAGFLSGRDEGGREFVFVPQSSPVLPGQTRTLALYPQFPEGAPSVPVSFPIRLSGRLDGSGRRLDVDEVFHEE